MLSSDITGKSVFLPLAVTYCIALEGLVRNRYRFSTRAMLIPFTAISLFRGGLGVVTFARAIPACRTSLRFEIVGDSRRRSLLLRQFAADNRDRFRGVDTKRYSTAGNPHYGDGNIVADM